MHVPPGNPDPDPGAASAGLVRLFIALWPSAELVAALRALGDSVQDDPQARVVAAPRLHLTLHFLGPVPRLRLDALQAALCVPFAPFELHFTRCDRWPKGLVVIEPDQVPPALVELHGALAQRLRALRLRTERRALRPHVTLARRHDRPLLAASGAAATLRWVVRDFVLAESAQDGSGRYRILQRCTAAGPPPSSAPAPGP